MVLRELQARCSFDVAGICWNHVVDVNRGSISKLKTFANFKLWTLWTNLWFCGHWVSWLGGGSRGAEEAEDAIGQALPSSTSLLPAEVSGASSSQADQPEITVPTLVPGMVAATPNSLDGTQKELGPKSGRSPEALDWHSCDSSDSMEAAHLQRVQKSQNSTPSDDLVDSRSPQSKRSRTHSPTSRSSFVLPVACLVVVELVPFQMPTFWKEISGNSAGFWVTGWRLDTCYFCPLHKHLIFFEDNWKILKEHVTKGSSSGATLSFATLSWCYTQPTFTQRGFASPSWSPTFRVPPLKLPNMLMSMAFHATKVGVEDLPEAVLDGVTSPGQAMQPRCSSCFGQTCSTFVEVLEYSLPALDYRGRPVCPCTILHLSSQLTDVTHVMHVYSTGTLKYYILIRGQCQWWYVCCFAVLKQSNPFGTLREFFQLLYTGWKTVFSWAFSAKAFLELEALTRKALARCFQYRHVYLTEDVTASLVLYPITHSSTCWKQKLQSLLNRARICRNRPSQVKLLLPKHFLQGRSLPNLNCPNRRNLPNLLVRLRSHPTKGQRKDPRHWRGSAKGRILGCSAWNFQSL